MLDFIKMLFRKSHKKTTKKNHVRPSQPNKVHKPECCCKKDESVHTKPAPVAKPVVEEVKAEPIVEAPKKVEEPVESREVTEVKDETPAIPMEAKYTIKALKSGAYKFELTSPAGKCIVKSGEYTLKRSCVSGIQSVQKNGSTKNIEDRTAEKIVKMPNPKYEIFLDEAGKYRFNLKAPNGYVILTSSAYSSVKSCTKVIESVIEHSSTEKIED